MRFGACAIQNGAHEEEEEGAAGHEEEGEDIGTGAAAAVHALVLALFDNPQFLHYCRTKGPRNQKPRQYSDSDARDGNPGDSFVGHELGWIRFL